MSKRVLLIDGDMVAYRVAAAEEKGYDFEGQFVLSADLDQGKENLDLMLSGWLETLEADHLVLYFTAPDNYRKKVLPSYKSNRNGVRRPMLLEALKQHCIDTYATQIVPTLEADDVLGIVATEPRMLKEYAEKVIVTWDKDLRTIPGLHWNPEKGWKEVGKDKVPVIDKVNLHEADVAFYSQVLSGDAVDGYPGCPGVGKKRAEEIIRNGTLIYAETTVVQRGKNAGQERTRWLTKHHPEPWEVIVSHYQRCLGVTYEEAYEAALQTARVARILRAGEYDFKKKEPVLWTP